MFDLTHDADQLQDYFSSSDKCIVTSTDNTDNTVLAADVIVKIVTFNDDTL